MSPPSTRQMKTVAGISRWIADNAMLFSDESPFAVDVGAGASDLVVVTGENASGKSLFVRIAAVLCNDRKVVPVSVSIRERTGGSHEDGGMRRVMMFGDEHMQSTGATSFGVVQRAFGNLDRDGGSILIVDEPELGLSDGYSEALGRYIGQQSIDVPACCRGVIVVTHSRSLVRGLVAGRGESPTHAAVSARDRVLSAGLERWLEEREERTVDDLLALADAAHARQRAVQKLLNDAEA